MFSESGMISLSSSTTHPQLHRASGSASHAGSLIINADDWGRDRNTTDRILECVVRGTVSSVSAMVFMADSDRAAKLALEHGVDTGLHLNFTTSFSASQCPRSLMQRQHDLAKWLLRYRLAPAMFHPGLMGSFEYEVAAQIDEFRRLYGTEPRRLDGHHHMHLCANVVWGRLLPSGTNVRRNFSFRPGEKSLGNRLYRGLVDRMLARRHPLVDFLFSLAPLGPADRLEHIASLARRFVVEVETHPVNPEEYSFLMGGEILRQLGDLPIEARFALPMRTDSGRKNYA
jgi:chitin disaccharide deacetylase